MAGGKYMYIFFPGLDNSLTEENTLYLFIFCLEKIHFKFQIYLLKYSNKYDSIKKVLNKKFYAQYCINEAKRATTRCILNSLTSMEYHGQNKSI